MCITPLTSVWIQRLTQVENLTCCLMIEFILAHNSRRVSYICFQTSYPSGDEWAVIVSGEILLYSSHLQKHKTSDLSIRPASDSTLGHSSHYAQGETTRLSKALADLREKWTEFLLSPRWQSSISASPDPAAIYLQEEDSNECNGEGDHHFGVLLRW